MFYLLNNFHGITQIMKTCFSKFDMHKADICDYIGSIVRNFRHAVLETTIRLQKVLVYYAAIYVQYWQR
jgi:hypothetical protein